MKLKSLLLVQFIAWGIFTLADFFAENYLIDFQMKVCLYVPIVIGVLYFVRKRLLWDKEKEIPIKQVKQIAKLCFQWFIITLCATVFISVLVLNNIWIVGQHTDLLNIFNGVEYIVFGEYFLFPTPIVLVIVGEFLIFLFRKCSSFWKMHK